MMTSDILFLLTVLAVAFLAGAQLLWQIPEHIDRRLVAALVLALGIDMLFR